MKIFLNIIMIIAIMLYLMSVQFKKKYQILLIQIFSSMCYAIVYYFQKGYSAFFTEIIEQVKDIIFYPYAKKNKKIPVYYLIVFLLILVVIAIIFYNGPLSLLPLVINLLYFISTYYKNPKAIRVIMLINAFLWMIYNYSLGLYLLIVGNTFEVISALLALYRFSKRKKKKC